jgi:hypothetical protein
MATNSLLEVLPDAEWSSHVDIVLGSTSDDNAETSSQETPPITILSEEHNAARKEEFEKMHAEHPRETTALFRNRVLGAIAVTRGKHNPLSYYAYT